ncbi:TonB-dependent vitamin B12 receptor [Pseudomonadota bacterium]
MYFHCSPTAALLSACYVFSNCVFPSTAMASDVEPFVVTATRTTQTVDESLASVTVVTRKDIEQFQAHSTQDLLRGVAGLNIINNGGAGKNTSLFMRGTESDHVLVLVDGVKIGSATTGSAKLQSIDVSQIERIEIVRGPRSSLYGADAIGGAIQIFTRKGKGPSKTNFSVGADSQGTYSAHAGIAGGDNTRWYSANLNHINTDGFNACSGKPSPGGAGCFVNEPDDDGYRDVSVSLRGGYRFTNGIEAEISALRDEGDNEYDGARVNESSSMQQVLSTTVRMSPTPFWYMTLGAGQSRDQSDNFLEGVFKSRFNTKRDSATWQNDITMGENRLLTLGLDRQLDRIDGTTAYAINSRGNSALFSQYQETIGAHNLQLSARRDDNEQFGLHTTSGIALGTDLSHGLRGTVSYGTAFKAPTFNELYFPGYGSATLQPEESRSVEIGIASKGELGHWAMNIYETRIENLIAYDASLSAPNNLNQARIHGLETVWRINHHDWEINTNITLLSPKNRASGANYNKRLPRRAKHSLRIDIDRSLDVFQLGASLRAEGERYDDLRNSRRLGGYSTMDLRAGYNIAKAWQLQTRIENIFDKHYETAAFFNQPDRTLFVTLRYQP